ncbi:unnamed protein product [Gemmataceae bacterium]|nr:unnamed protein product [Gemmataceae bacterium]VTT99898.1 unnamed protein product [Gemmataceae bacterium]
MRTRSFLAAAGLLALAWLSAQPLEGQEPKEPTRDEKKAPDEPKTPALDLKLEVPPDAIPGTFRMFLVKDGRFEPLKDVDGKLLKGPTGKDIPSPKNREGKIHCLVCENGLAPMVAVFVRTGGDKVGPDTGVGKLAKNLNTLVPKYRADKLSGFVAFLQTQPGTKVVTVKNKRPDGSEYEEKVEADMEYPDDEGRDKFATDILGAADGLNVPNVPFGLAAQKSKALTAWGVGDNDEVTVVVYYRMRRVGQPFVFAKAEDLTDEKVNEILKTAERAILQQK